MQEAGIVGWTKLSVGVVGWAQTAGWPCPAMSIAIGGYPEGDGFVLCKLMQGLVSMHANGLGPPTTAVVAPATAPRLCSVHCFTSLASTHLALSAFPALSLQQYELQANRCSAATPQARCGWSSFGLCAAAAAPWSCGCRGLYGSIQQADKTHAHQLRGSKLHMFCSCRHDGSSR